MTGARAFTLALIVAGLAGCADAPIPSTLEVATTGQPPGEEFAGYGGYRIEATLLRELEPIGTWEPARRPSLPVDPGAYVLVIRGRSVSDLISCTMDGPNPTCLQEIGEARGLCRTPVTLPPGSTVRLSIDLASRGPGCTVLSG